MNSNLKKQEAVMAGILVNELVCGGTIVGAQKFTNAFIVTSTERTIDQAYDDESKKIIHVRSARPDQYQCDETIRNIILKNLTSSIFMDDGYIRPKLEARYMAKTRDDDCLRGLKNIDVFSLAVTANKDDIARVNEFLVNALSVNPEYVTNLTTRMNESLSTMKNGGLFVSKNLLDEITNQMGNLMDRVREDSNAKTVEELSVNFELNQVGNLMDRVREDSNAKTVEELSANFELNQAQTTLDDFVDVRQK